MLKYELKKYMSKLIFMFIIFGTGYFLMLSFSHTSIEKKTRQHYEEYISLLEGLLDEEKKSYIADEYERVNIAIKNASNDIQTGKQIDINQLDYALEHEKAWQMIYDRYLNLLNTENTADRVFYSDLDLQDYFKNSEINYFEIFLLVIIALYAATSDFHDNRHVIIKSTCNGNIAYISTKQNALLCAAVAISVLFSFIEFIYIAVTGNVSMLSLPIKSMLGFSNLEWSMTIGEYILLRGINHIIWCIVTVLIMCMTGLLTKRLQTGLFIGSFTIVMPLALKDVCTKRLLVWIYSTHLDKEFTLCSSGIAFPKITVICAVAAAVIYIANILLYKTAKI